MSRQKLFWRYRQFFSAWHKNHSCNWFFRMHIYDTCFNYPSSFVYSIQTLVIFEQNYQNKQGLWFEFNFDSFLLAIGLCLKVDRVFSLRFGGRE